MPHKAHSGLRRVFKQMLKSGFTLIKLKNGVKIYHPKTGRQRIFHWSHKAYYPLRHWLKVEFGMLCS